MPSIQRIVIWGAGGHAKVVADIVRRGSQLEVAGFLDDASPGRVDTEFYGAPIYDDAIRLSELLSSGIRQIVIAIGDNESRLRKADLARQAGFVLPAIIDPAAIVSASAGLDEGVVVGPGAIVNADTSLARCVIVNSGAIVEHDCKISEGAHIASGATLAGHVSVGSCSLVGVGATVRDRIQIGQSSIVGAGSVVVHDVPDNAVAYGVPARVVRRSNQD